MPTEFASAIADLRLSPDKLKSDYAAAQRELLALTRRLESQATVAVSLTIDVAKTQRELNRAVSRLSAANALTLPIGIDADNAIAELVALQGIVDPIAVPVTAMTDDASADIAALRNSSANDPIVVPVSADSDALTSSLDNVVNSALPRAVSGFGNFGEESGKAFADRFSRITQATVGSLSLAVGGFLATSLFRGYQRLTTIEDATASLTVALGSAAEAGRVLDDVLDVVTGTPFNLDQFATAASNMISFGVEAEKVPGYLEAIGEASATRGSRANEFAQRLADTFGQISVQGRIMGEDLLSLQSTGVDALRILGNSFGVTTVEMREMVSEGAVPAEEALQILSDGILNGSTGVNGATVAFAGTMERLRETLTGAQGGFRSATARLGVAIIKPFEEALTAGFNAGTDIINQFNTTITDALGGLADSEGFERFLDFIAEVPDKIDPLIETLQGLGPALAPLAGAFGAAGLGQLSAVLGPLGAVVPQVGAVTAAIAAFVAFTPELREELLPVLVELGKTAAFLGAGLGDALGEALKGLTPLLVQFIQILGDMSPTIQAVAGLTVALSQGLVPILSTFADILEGFPLDVVVAIGGAFLAWKSIQAIQGPITTLQTKLAGVSERLNMASFDGERFGNTMTGVAGKVGVTGTRVQAAATAMSTAMNVAATAAAGFFSGMALNSEDATTQAVGFLGAATSIGTAFATTGPVGGLVTTAAVVGGALTDMWVDSRRAAEEYAADIEELAEQIIEDMGRAVAALLDARDLAGEDVIVDQAIELIGEDEVLRLKGLGVELKDIMSAARDPAFVENLKATTDAVADAANTAAAARVQALYDAGDPLAGEQYGQIYAEEFQIGFKAAMEAAGDPLGIGGLAQTFEGPFGPELDTTLIDDITGYVEDVTGLYGDTIDEIGRQDAQAQIRAETLLDNLLPDDATQAEFVRRGAAMQLDIDEVVEKLNAAKTDLGGQDGLDALFAATIPQDLPLDPFEIITKGLDNVSDQYGYTIEVAEDGSIDFVKATDDMADGMDGVGPSAEEMAAAVDLAMKQATEATKRFNESLDEMLDTLDKVTEQQDYAAGFRDIGSALAEITNSDELKEAEGLIEDIGKQRDDIAKLEKRMAQEQVDANIEAADLDRRIAEAEKYGAVEGAAALRAARDNVFAEVDEIGAEIAAKEQEIADLAGRAAQLSQTPVTLAELLQGQADQFTGGSLLDLLILAPTPEAQDFFQSQLAPQIEQAGVLIQRALDENPLLASVEIPSLIEGLISGLTGTGLSEDVARQLVESVFDPKKLATDAVNVFASEFNADVTNLDEITRKILAGEQIDPSVDIDAIVNDVDGSIAELEAMEAAGLEIPGDIDLAGARDTLTAFQTAYDESDFELIIPITGDLTGIISDLEALQAFALSLQVQEEAPDGLGPTFGNSAGTGYQGNVPWWLKAVEQEPRNGSGRNSGSIRYSADGNLFYYKDGGLSENHIAQLVHGGDVRVWKEPETGGEAYIPLAASKRGRSTNILKSVADIFGLDVIPRSAFGGGVGMSEDTMAAAVERGVKAGRTPSAAARARAHDRAESAVKIDKIEVNGVRDPNRAAQRMIRRLSDVAMGLTDWDEDY